MCIAQVAATDQENVFGPLAQRGDLGCLQVGGMLGQRIGHRLPRVVMANMRRGSGCCVVTKVAQLAWRCTSAYSW